MIDVVERQFCERIGAGIREWILIVTLRVPASAVFDEPIHRCNDRRACIAIRRWYRSGITTMTIEEVRKDLDKAVGQSLRGEEVIITVGVDALRLVRDVPLRPPGFFAACYGDSVDAAFEELICRDSPALPET